VRFAGLLSQIPASFPALPLEAAMNSLRLLKVALTAPHAFGRLVADSRGAVAGVDEGGDGWVTAQFVQAAAAGGPDAADRETQPGADIGV
jgi:hypothetical protein